MVQRRKVNKYRTYRNIGIHFRCYATVIWEMYKILDIITRLSHCRETAVNRNFWKTKTVKYYIRCEWDIWKMVWCIKFRFPFGTFSDLNYNMTFSKHTSSKTFVLIPINEYKGRAINPFKSFYNFLDTCIKLLKWKW